MDAISGDSRLNEHKRAFGGHVMPAGSVQNEMVAAAEQVVRAAREAGSVDAERVLNAVLELLKVASGENTKTA